MKRAEPENADFYDNVRTINDEYTESGHKVLTLFEHNDIEGAKRIHLDEEHVISHKLEALLRPLIATAKKTW